MRCNTSSLLTGCRVAISLSQASLRVRPGITGDSACGPAAVKFLDLEFIGDGHVVNGEHVVAVRQSYQQEPEFVGVANKKVMVLTEWKSSTVIPMLTFQYSILNFTIRDLGNARTSLSLGQAKQAKIKAPIRGKVVHWFGGAAATGGRLSSPTQKHPVQLMYYAPVFSIPANASSVTGL